MYAYAPKRMKRPTGNRRALHVSRRRDIPVKVTLRHTSLESLLKGTTSERP
jgi:hypothetical protein